MNVSYNLNDLLAHRYGVTPDFANEVAKYTNPVLETMLAHRSVRSYRKQALDSGMLEIIVAAAQSASSSSNLQTYSIIAVEDQAHKEILAELCHHQQHIADCSVYLIFIADLARSASIGQRQRSTIEALDYEEMLIMATIDAALAGQNAALAAESLGLGTCYIGGARNQPREIAADLKLPERCFAVFGLTIGYPLDNHEQIKPRLPQNPGILHREYYDINYDASLADYEEAMHRFNESQSGRRGRGWLDIVANRVALADSFSGDRAKLKQILEERKLGVK